MTRAGNSRTTLHWRRRGQDATRQVNLPASETPTGQESLPAGQRCPRVDGRYTLTFPREQSQD